MTGEEIHDILTRACARTGLPQATTRHLLLNFSIIWGEQLLTMTESAIFTEMTADLERPMMVYRGGSAWHEHPFDEDHQNVMAHDGRYPHKHLRDGTMEEVMPGPDGLPTPAPTPPLPPPAPQPGPDPE